MKSSSAHAAISLGSLIVLCYLVAGCAEMVEPLGLPAGSTPGAIALQTSSSTPPLPSTLTPTLPSTPEPSFTFTILPTLTLTPSPTRTSPPEPDPEACLPGDSLAEYGIVDWVFDSRTLVVDIRGRSFSVRYIGVDENANSSETNDSLVGHVVELVRDVSDTDKHGQLLRYVLLQEDRFINYELIRSGAARVEVVSPDVACADIFKGAERLARQENLGVWAFVPRPTVTATPTPTITPITLPSLTPTGQPSQTQTTTPTITPTSQISPTTTPTPTITPTKVITTHLYISSIFYDGVVPDVESDEYAVITNNTSQAVNLQNWRLHADDSGQDYYFPSFIVQTGQSCRVYTDEIHPEFCGFSFGSNDPVWNNDGDCGYLYNPSGTLVDDYCY